MGDIHPKTQGTEFPIYLCVHKNHTAYVLYRMHFFLKNTTLCLKKKDPFFRHLFFLINSLKNKAKLKKQKMF